MKKLLYALMLFLSTQSLFLPRIKRTKKGKKQNFHRGTFKKKSRKKTAGSNIRETSLQPQTPPQKKLAPQIKKSISQDPLADAIEQITLFSQEAKNFASQATEQASLANSLKNSNDKSKIKEIIKAITKYKEQIDVNINSIKYVLDNGNHYNLNQENEEAIKPIVEGAVLAAEESLQKTNIALEKAEKAL